MVARRHHFISQCYLRGFTVDPKSPQLFVTDLRARRQFWTSPTNVALEQNFHTVDVPGHSPDVVEKRIAEFESDLGPALLRIREARSLADDHDRGMLMFFMALLTIKNPRMRHLIGSFMGDVAKVDLKARAADPEHWAAEMARSKAEGTIPQDADVDAMRKHVLEDAFEFSVSTPGHLHMEFNLVDKLLPYFGGRKWAFCEGSAGRTTFITSDNPVCLMWKDPSRSDAPGLGRSDTQIIFPIANELAIIGVYEDVSCQAGVVDNLIPIVNGAILTCVDRQVYARGDDFVYVMPHDSRTMHGKEILDGAVSKAPDV